MRSACILGLVPMTLVLFFVAPLWGQMTHNVPADFPTIQEAIDFAVNGDTVLVAPGTYFENIDFDGNAITVASSDGPDSTTIDGGQSGSVVSFTSNEGPSSILDGFRITEGLGALDGSVDHPDLGTPLDQSVYHRPRGAAGPEHDGVLSRQFGLTFERPDGADPVGVAAEQSPVAQGHRIDRTDAPGLFVDLVEVVHHLDFVRNRHGDLPQPQRAKSHQGIAECVRWHVEREIGGVDAQRPEGGVVHWRGSRMPGRVQDDAA